MATKIQAFIGILFVATVGFGKTLPPDAQKLLNTLPNKKVSLNVIIHYGLKVSDSYKVVASQDQSVDAAKLQAESALAPQVSFSGAHLTNGNEPTNGFSPTKITANSGTVGISKYFATGTSLSGEFDYSDTSQQYSDDVAAFSSALPSEIKEAKGSFSLAQNLWKDSFGYATRRGLASAREQSKASKHGVEEAKEDWFINLASIFYSAWLSQEEAKAASTNRAIQERLLKITQVKRRRGTAEEPDLLQVQSALLSAQVAEDQAKQNLSEKWRQLVVALRMPMSWLKIDPMLVPLDLNNPFQDALRLCYHNNKAPTDQTATLLKQKSLFEAARLSLDQAENNNHPSLTASLNYITNGITQPNGTEEHSFARAVQEASGGEHPYFLVGLELSFPFGFKAEKAAEQSARANKIMQEALWSQAKDNHEVDWLNRCGNLKRLSKAHRELSSAKAKQTKRASLEERRFRLGRTPTLNVIQAANDATRSSLTLSQLTVEQSLKAWEVKRQAGQLKNYLKERKVSP